MGPKHVNMSDQIRAAVDSCGISRYQICKETGIDQAALSRFMAGTGITTSTLDKLAKYLDLTIVKRRKRRS